MFQKWPELLVVLLVFIYFEISTYVLSLCFNIGMYRMCDFFNVIFIIRMYSLNKYYSCQLQCHLNKYYLCHLFNYLLNFKLNIYFIYLFRLFIIIFFILIQLIIDISVEYE